MHTIPAETLPQRLREFADLIGVDAALALARAFGGLRIYIPTPPHCRADNRIAQIIGLDKLIALAHTYGGPERTTIPAACGVRRWQRNDALMRERAAGASISQLARKFGVTERQVARILAGARP